MKKYVTYIRCSALEMIGDRNNFIIGILANFIQIVSVFFIWQGLYKYESTVNGFTWGTMRNYLVAAFFCNGIFSFSLESNMSESIINGNIVLELIKPVNHKLTCYFKNIGAGIVEAVIIALFTIIVAPFIISINLIKIANIFLFLFSLLFALTIKFQIQYLFSLFCFYTDSSYGIIKTRQVICNLLSGALIPIIMMPELLRQITEYTPFKCMVYYPCSIFIGNCNRGELIKIFLLQVFWILLLNMVIDSIWKRTVKNLSLYGG